ncbi:MAG: hypothetical protein ACRDG5_11900 [Anaerolineales bacterium]
MDEEARSPVSRASGLTAGQRWIFVGAALLAVLLIAGVVLAVVNLSRNPDQTEMIRDIVIILLAVESWFLGLALILLMVQLMRLAALLQNEVRPLLDSTNETLGTLKGTTVFLSRNLVRPVIRINSSVSALRRVLDLLRYGRSD